MLIMPMEESCIALVIWRISPIPVSVRVGSDMGGGGEGGGGEGNSGGGDGGGRGVRGDGGGVGGDGCAADGDGDGSAMLRSKNNSSSKA